MKRKSSNLHSLHGTHAGVFVDGYMIPLGIMDASLSKWSHDDAGMITHTSNYICHNLPRLHPQKTTMEPQTEWTVRNLPSSGHLFFPTISIFNFLPSSWLPKAVKPSRVNGLLNRQPIPTWCTTSTISRRWAETWHIFGPEKNPCCAVFEDSGVSTLESSFSR